MEITKEKSSEFVDKSREIIQQKRKKRLREKTKHLLHTQVSNTLWDNTKMSHNLCHQSLRREKSMVLKKCPNNG